jgi:hypothetical protein
MLVVLVDSCYVGMTFEDKRRLERIRESDKMFRKTQKVRRRSTSGKLKSSVKYQIRQIKKRSVYYS